RSHAAAGTPSEVAARLESFRAAGAGRLYLQVLDLDDLDHLRLIAAEVAPQLG
ncbi:MAG: LLM class F420-dependent oxidoreductase, partial [Actinomycetota bacterium]|nr:LLM class F420-dependent oxidoreductase [Actinomycetota bacterium]